MPLQKYLFNKKTDSVFKFKYTDTDEVLCANLSVGWLHHVSISPLDFEFKIDAYINSVLVFTDLKTYQGSIIFNPIDIIVDSAKTICDEVIITVTIKNPLDLRELILWHENLAEIIDYSGMDKLELMYSHQSRRSINLIPDNLINNKSLTELVIFSDTLTNFDDRFFQGGLVNLQKLSLGFSYVDGSDHNIDNLKLLPNLLELEYDDVHGNSIDFNFPFDQNFDYPIEKYTLFLRLSTTLEEIPSNIKYLNRLKEFSIENYDFKDFTFPIDGATNNTLEKISASGSGILQNYLKVTRNIKELLALKEIDIAFNNRASTVLLDSEFDWFYDYFYTHLYNETNNLNNGYGISSLSFVSAEPHGFQHDNFRILNFCGNNSWNNKNSISKQIKVNEINSTGFTFTTFYV